MTDFTLTSSQREAVAAFRDFLGSDAQVFMLKGAAGTGKTTLVTEFLKLLEDEGRDFGLMAPTGRAAYIIAAKTGKPAFTIHRSIYSFSNLKPVSAAEVDADVDGAVSLRYSLKVNSSPLSTVYIVDESSMVSDKASENEAFSFGSGCLLSDLFKYASGRKIIFVGDYAQLPPVGMNSSPALDKDYIERKFGCGVAEIMLREVMRQSEGSVMLANAAKIRDSIERKTFVEFKLDDVTDSKREDADLLAPYYRLSASAPSAKAAIIAYSNKQAADYNFAVRRHYYGVDAPRLRSGDLLMVCRNNYSFELELFNGNIVQVEACQPDAEVIRRHVGVKVGKGRIEYVDLAFRKATIRFAACGKPVSLNVMLLDNFLDDRSGAVGGLLAQALIVDFNNRLPAPVKEHINEIRRWLKSKEILTLRQRELRDIYVNLLCHDPYYNSLICKYGYAMTCHKAQGGEWDNVFVDMCRFGGTSNENYFRWAYTALTRASRMLWHFHAPEFDYISNLVVEEIKPAPKIKVSIYAGEGNFLDARFARIRRCAEKLGLSVAEDRSKSYQHIVKFAGGDSDYAEFQLWYGAKGYSARGINAKDALLSASSEEFAAQCVPLVDESLAPESVPFAAPGRPFAEKLVAFVRSQLEETGIQLLDIAGESYQDVFHLKADGLAQIGFFYTDKGNYTYMWLTGSLGQDDQKLQALRERFL